jgi:hypothetical protein
VSKATKYTEVKKKIAALKTELKNAASEAFADLSKDVFTANPSLISFGWAQYTPYFNDGDTCTFSALTSYPTVTIKASDGVEVTYDSNRGEYTDGDDNEIEDTALYSEGVDKLEESVQEFLGSFDDDDLLTMFGDHQKVTVKRDGTVDLNDYEHE